MQELTKEQQELLDEAKRRYPVGTRFNPAHFRDDDEAPCLMTEDSKVEFNGSFDTIYALIDGSKWNPSPKYGGASLARCLYINGKWAEIVSLPRSEEKPMFADAVKGDYVYSNTYGDGIVTYNNLSNLGVYFDRAGGEVEYKTTGWRYYHKTVERDLYWSKPEIIAPPRPKRIVEKTVDCWVNTDELTKGSMIPDVMLVKPTQPEYYTKATLTYKTEE